LHRTATSWAASMAAYGEDSSRSALTFMPPVMRHMVSLPDRSVTCTNAANNRKNVSVQSHVHGQGAAVPPMCSTGTLLLEKLCCKLQKSFRAALALDPARCLRSHRLETTAQSKADSGRHSLSLKDAKMWQTPKTFSPSRVAGPSDTFSFSVRSFLGAMLACSAGTCWGCTAAKGRAQSPPCFLCCD